MTNKAVSYAKRSANEDLVLNAGRVNDGVNEAGCVDVDKTLALLDEALDGRLFQDVSRPKSVSKPEEEIIVVQEGKQENLEQEVTIETKVPELDSVKPLAPKSDLEESTKPQNRTWLSRLTARITKRAS